MECRITDTRDKETDQGFPRIDRLFAPLTDLTWKCLSDKVHWAEANTLAFGILKQTLCDSPVC